MSADWSLRCYPLAKHLGGFQVVLWRCGCNFLALTRCLTPTVTLSFRLWVCPENSLKLSFGIRIEIHNFNVNGLFEYDFKRMIKLIFHINKVVEVILILQKYDFLLMHWLSLFLYNLPGNKRAIIEKCINIKKMNRGLMVLQHMACLNGIKSSLKSFRLPTQSPILSPSFDFILFTLWVNWINLFNLQVFFSHLHKVRWHQKLFLREIDE